MRLIEDFRYRPEIDGLRAIAVLAVVLYHAGFGCTGGYVGVDIFFVISGFLITSLIWKDLESGRFTFAHFWERRARRIVPALLVVTITTLVVGWCLLLPDDVRRLGQATAAQALFAANILYCLTSGYFAPANDEKPLLHTWSLAVEEQFYLVVPFLMWGIYRIVSLRGRVRILSLLGIGIVVSLAMSIYAVSHYPVMAFYLLPTRAWELLLGSLVAFLPASTWLASRRNIREILAFAGMALILVPIFLYTPETPFPGLAALPPCLGAALFLLVNRRSDDAVPTLGGRLLALRVPVFIGLISYSLYLWHWPLLAFSRYAMLTPLSFGYRAAMVALGFVLAFLSWKYVETPFRERKLGSTRLSLFKFAGTGLVAVLAIGILFLKLPGLQQLRNPQARAIAAAIRDWPFAGELTTADVRAGKLISLGAADPDLRRTVLVWGDSHGMGTLPAFDAFLKENGIAGYAAYRPGTPPILNYQYKAENRSGGIEYNSHVFSFIADRQIRDVILVANWKGYYETDPKRAASLVPSILETVQRLTDVGCRTWILRDVPYPAFNVPKALALYHSSPDYIESLCARPTPTNDLEAIDPTLVAKIEAAGGRILDPKPYFLDPTGTYYRVKADDIVLYWDREHLTMKGAKHILLPFLRDSTLQSALRTGSEREVEQDRLRAGAVTTQTRQ